MHACGFLVGRWSGEGWASYGPGPRHSFHETESIEAKLEGLLLLIQGHGTDEGGKTVHDALAIMSYDPQDKHYHFRAYEQMGRSVDSVAQCHNNTMTWSLAAGPTTIRYTISLNAKGQWHEIGTAIIPNAPEQQIFEMTLDKASG